MPGAPPPEGAAAQAHAEGSHARADELHARAEAAPVDAAYALQGRDEHASHGRLGDHDHAGGAHAGHAQPHGGHAGTHAELPHGHAHGVSGHEHAGGHAEHGRVEHGGGRAELGDGLLVEHGGGGHEHGAALSVKGSASSDGGYEHGDGDDDEEDNEDGDSSEGSDDSSSEASSAGKGEEGEEEELITSAQKLHYANIIGRLNLQADLQPRSCGCLRNTNPLRRLAVRIANADWFGYACLGVILANCVMLAIFDPLDRDDSGPRNRAIEASDPYFQALFTLEMIIKITAFGLLGFGPSGNRVGYISDPWNWLDGIIVISGFIKFLPGGGSNTSVLRTFRVLRPLRTLAAVPSMKLVVNSVLNALPALGNVVVLALFSLLVFGIIGIQLWTGLLRGRCAYVDPTYDPFAVTRYDNATHAALPADPVWAFTTKLCGMSCDVQPGAQCTANVGYSCAAVTVRYVSYLWPGYDNATYDVARDLEATCMPLGEDAEWGSTDFDNMGFGMLAIFLGVTLARSPGSLWMETMYATFHTWGNGWIVATYWIMLVSFGAFFLLQLALAVIWNSYQRSNAQEVARAERLLAIYGPQLVHYLHWKKSRSGSPFKVRREFHAPAASPSSVEGAELAAASSLSSPAPAMRELAFLVNGGGAGSGAAAYALGGRGADSGTVSAHGVELELVRLSPQLAAVEGHGHELAPAHTHALADAHAHGHGDAGKGEHGREMHGHEAHGHNAHGHDANGHDAHGHGAHSYDAHGHEAHGHVVHGPTKVPFAGPPKKWVFIPPSANAPDPEALQETLEALAVFNVVPPPKTVYAPLRPWISAITNHPYFGFTMTGIICLNTLQLAMPYADMSADYKNGLDIANYAFLAFFGGEFVLKMLGDGPLLYCSDNFNIFDGCVVMLSFVDTTLTAVLDKSGGGLAALRTFRLARLFRLARSLKDLQRLIGTIVMSLQNVSSAVSVLVIILFIFTLLQMQIFGGKFQDAVKAGALEEVPRSNYDTLWTSFISTFATVTGFVQVHEIYAAFGPSMVIVPVVLQLIGSVIFLNLFIAIVLGAFEEQMEEEHKRAKEANDKAAKLAYKARKKAERAERKQREAREKAERLAAEAEAEREARATGRTSPALQLGDDAAEGGHRSGFTRASGADSTRSSPDKPLGHKVAEHHVTKVKGKAGAEIELRVLASGNLVVVTEKERTGSEYDADFAFYRLGVPYELKDGADWHRDQTALMCLRPSNWLRRAAAIAVAHPYFERFILLLILISSVNLALDEPRVATCSSLPISDPGNCVALALWLWYADRFLTAFFCLEMALKIVALGFFSHPTAYLRNGWNLLDFIIVIISVISLALADLANKLRALRAVRALRALRPLRLVSRYPGLKLVVNAVIGAIPKVKWVFLVNIMFMFLLAVIGLQNFAGALRYCNSDNAETRSTMEECTGNWTLFGTDCELLPSGDEVEECLGSVDGKPFPNVWQNHRQHFDDIFRSLLTVFEVAHGEGWPEIMWPTVDATGPNKPAETNANPAAAIFFIVTHVSVGFFLLEMFTGVIIANYYELKEEDSGGGLLTEAQKEWIESMKTMLTVSAAVTMKRPRDPFRPLRLLRARVFDFVMAYHFEVAIMTVIMLNTSVLAMRHYAESQNWFEFEEYANDSFAIVFALEATLKLVAFGPRQYFSVAWNKFDFTLVMASLIGVIFKAGPIATLFRVFRVARIFRLIRFSPGLLMLFRTLIMAVPSLANVGIVLLLIIFIFSCVGMNLFEGVKYGEFLNEDANFDSFFTSMLTLFRCATGGDFNGLLHDLEIQPPYCYASDKLAEDGSVVAPANCGNLIMPSIYFSLFETLTLSVLIKLIIAVVLDAFSEMVKNAESETFALTPDMLDAYTDAWGECDPDATKFVTATSLLRIIEDLPEPLGVKPPPPGKAVAKSHAPLPSPTSSPASSPKNSSVTTQEPSPDAHAHLHGHGRGHTPEHGHAPEHGHLTSAGTGLADLGASPLTPDGRPYCGEMEVASPSAPPLSQRKRARALLLKLDLVANVDGGFAFHAVLQELIRLAHVEDGSNNVAASSKLKLAALLAPDGKKVYNLRHFFAAIMIQALARRRIACEVARKRRMLIARVRVRDPAIQFLASQNADLAVQLSAVREDLGRLVELVGGSRSPRSRRASVGASAAEATALFLAGGEAGGAGLGMQPLRRRSVVSDESSVRPMHSARSELHARGRGRRSSQVSLALPVGLEADTDVGLGLPVTAPAHAHSSSGDEGAPLLPAAGGSS